MCLQVADRGVGYYLSCLGADERNTVKLIDGNRGNPNKTVISKSGLYKLILRSDKAEARQFQDWVTRHVLPAIRKDGSYVMVAARRLWARRRSAPER